MYRANQNTILITGGNGFVGANLTKKLLEDTGKELHLLVTPQSDLWRIEEDLPRLFLHRVNLEDSDQLQHIVTQVRPETIFHLAAHGASSKHNDQSRILRSNILGTFNLLNATKEIDYSSFVYSGGSSEYGKKETSMKETDFLQPTSFYGASKACATLLAQCMAQLQQKPITLLRFFSVYGPLESSLRLIPTAIEAALKRRPMQLTAPGFSRDFVFVEDVVQACLLCSQQSHPGEIFNIGSGSQKTNEEVIEEIEKLTGKPIQILPDLYPAHAMDKPHWVADISKAKRVLGWEPVHTFQEGLQKMISFYSSQLNKELEAVHG